MQFHLLLQTLYKVSGYSFTHDFERTLSKIFGYDFTLNVVVLKINLFNLLLTIAVLTYDEIEESNNGKTVIDVDAEPPKINQ